MVVYFSLVKSAIHPMQAQGKKQGIAGGVMSIGRGMLPFCHTLASTLFR
jgi:hypothetical protein